MPKRAITPAARAFLPPNALSSGEYSLLTDRYGSAMLLKPAFWQGFAAAQQGTATPEIGFALQDWIAGADGFALIRARRASF